MGSRILILHAVMLNPSFQLSDRFACDTVLCLVIYLTCVSHLQVVDVSALLPESGNALLHYLHFNNNTALFE